MAIASTPAVGPRPTARTNSKAQTISGTLRSTISRPRTGQRRACAHQAGLPPRARALIDRARLARRAKGMANSQANAMPAVAMARVCKVAWASSSRKSRSWAGGQKPLTNWPMLRRLSGATSTARFSSLNCKPGHSRASASTVRSKRGRAAGSRRWAGFSIAEYAPPLVLQEQAQAPGWTTAHWRTRHPGALDRRRWPGDRT